METRKDYLMNHGNKNLISVVWVIMGLFMLTFHVKFSIVFYFCYFYKNTKTYKSTQ